MLERGKMDRDLIEIVGIESLVPKEHLLRKIDDAVDFNRLYQMVEPLYSEDNGRPSVYPVVLFKDVVVHTVRKHHANIRKCLEYAVRLGILTQNPASIVELPPKQKYKGATAYTPEQLKALLNIFQDDPLETVVHLAVTYGLRRSEICGLRWDAVDFVNNHIHICHTAVMFAPARTENRSIPVM